MKQIIRQGDSNEVGGIAIANFATSIEGNGRSVAKVGTLISPHDCCGRRNCDIHCHAVITTGHPSIFVEGVPIAIVGSLNSCGHHMVYASSDIETF